MLHNVNIILLQLDEEGFLLHGTLSKYVHEIAKDERMKDLVTLISKTCEPGMNAQAKGIT